MLVDVLVGDDLALQFRRSVVRGVAAEPVLASRNSTWVFGRMRSLLVRLILPVVKA